MKHSLPEKNAKGPSPALRDSGLLFFLNSIHELGRSPARHRSGGALPRRVSGKDPVPLRAPIPMKAGCVGCVFQGAGFDFQPLPLLFGLVLNAEPGDF